MATSPGQLWACGPVLPGQRAQRRPVPGAAALNKLGCIHLRPGSSTNCALGRRCQQPANMAAWTPAALPPAATPVPAWPPLPRMPQQGCDRPSPGPVPKALHEGMLGQTETLPDPEGRPKVLGYIPFSSQAPAPRPTTGVLHPLTLQPLGCTPRQPRGSFLEAAPGGVGGLTSTVRSPLGPCPGQPRDLHSPCGRGQQCPG